MKKHIRWICFSFFISLVVLLFAHFFSMTVTVINEHTPIERTYSVIIDAGHGGEDGGASSPNGIPESTYNLSIALKLEKLLQFLGQDTQMVRTSDVSVYTAGKTLAEKKRSDLKERVRIVNGAANGVLLSIHQNNFPDGKYHGAQVFYANTPGSKELANMLQHKITETLNRGSSRKTKKADGIYLMEHIIRPGVLIECGFLSNPQEEALLRHPEYQKKLACVIAVTLKSYLKGIENPNT